MVNSAIKVTNSTSTTSTRRTPHYGACPAGSPRSKQSRWTLHHQSMWPIHHQNFEPDGPPIMGRVRRDTHKNPTDPPLWCVSGGVPKKSGLNKARSPTPPTPHYGACRRARKTVPSGDQLATLVEMFLDHQCIVCCIAVFIGSSLAH